MLPSLSDTISLSSSPVYSQPNTHPLSESITLRWLPSSMKSIYPMFQKTNISLTTHHIFTDLNIKMPLEVIGFSPFIGRKFILKPVSVCCVFQDSKCRVRGRRQHEHNYEEHGPCSAVQNVLRMTHGQLTAQPHFQSQGPLWPNSLRITQFLEFSQVLRKSRTAGLQQNLIPLTKKVRVNTSNCASNDAVSS